MNQEDYPRTVLDLEQRFGNEEACIEYLATLRWPDGWVCPRCAGTEAWLLGRDRWRCGKCRYEMSVMAGTVFQDSHLPLTIWFQAMWQMTRQKNGISALGLQRVLGLGSYKTAWALLHKLRRAMVRPGRDRLDGVIEVDETYWGGVEAGAIGRLIESKALVIVAAQEDGKGIGRIRLRTIPDLSKATLHGFIKESIVPGSTVRTDGFPSYPGLEEYGHELHVQRHQEEGEYVLPRVHLVISQLKRWLLGTHQGSVGHDHLDDYLNEFTFRFNRRKSASRGKLFYRLAQQAVQIEPVPFAILVKPQLVVPGGVK
jgi:transposase-like protein